MIRFGPGGNCNKFYESGLKSTVQAPEFVKSHGLSAYEVEAGRGVMGSKATYEAIGEKARENGISLSIHAPYFISLSSTEEEKRLGSAKYILQSASALSSMGGETIVIHAGSTAKLDRAVALDYAKKALENVLERLSENGLYGFKLGIETMGKVNQLGTLDEVLSMCEVDKTIVPVVDFGHMNARECGGVFVTVDDYKRVFEKISSVCGAEVASKLHCHFSKIEYTKGGEKKHLTFSDEQFGPDPVIFTQAIAQLGVEPTVICESDGTQTQDALFMKNSYLSFCGGTK